jgi:hypothetical protein
MANAVFRAEVLKVEVGVDLNVARAKVRDAEAILRLLLRDERVRPFTMWIERN